MRVASFVRSLGIAAFVFCSAARSAANPPPETLKSLHPTIVVPASPSPSPAALKLEARPSLDRLAGSAIIIIGGRRLTVAALRSGERTATLAHLGSPTLHVRDFSLGSALGAPALGGSGVGSIAGGRVSNLGGVGTIVGGVGRGPGFHFSPAALAAVSATATNALGTRDPNYCASHPPYILHATGKVTSNGYVVLDGVCFGSGGTVRLSGSFPGGELALTVQHWDDGSITAAIPAVTGVFDQTARLQVVVGSTYSNELSVAFTAARERLALPAHFITSVQCDQRYRLGQCTDGTGFRMQFLDSTTGTDVWHVVAPQGWVLDSLSWSSGLGSIGYNGGFDQGSATEAQWSVTWGTGIETTTVTSTDYGFFVSSSTSHTYGSTYAQTVYAIGPAGTMPP